MREGTVVPHVGTWIEMVLKHASRVFRGVVPHVGTWIEISLLHTMYA